MGFIGNTVSKIVCEPLPAELDVMVEPPVPAAREVTEAPAAAPAPVPAA